MPARKPPGSCRLGLELLDAPLGGAERLLLSDDGLRHVIGSAGLRGDQVADQRLGLGIAPRRTALDGAKLVEKLLDGTPVLIVHLPLPLLHAPAGMAYGDAVGGPQSDGAAASGDREPAAERSHCEGRQAALSNAGSGRSVGRGHP